MKLVEVHACMPTTERGQGILVSGDANTNSIVYCNGRSVIIRSLDADMLRAEVYGEHAYPVTVARISPNGEWVASGDVSGTIRIWGTSPGHVLKYEYRALSGRIHDLQWSQDGQRIVVCGDGKGKSFVRAFMWDTGATVGDFEGSSKRVLSCAFKPSRPFRIVTCGEDFLVNFYEGPPFRFKSSHRHHTNFVNCVRFSPDGTKFITVGSDKKTIVYDGKTGDKIGECGAEDIGQHNGSIYAVSWNEYSSQVLTVSADKTAKVWDISNDGNVSLLRSYSLSTSSGAEDMQVGCIWLKHQMVTFSLCGKMNLLSVADDIRVQCGHVKSIIGVAADCGDGEDGVFYSASYDGVIIKWKSGVGFVRRLDNNGLTSIQELDVVGRYVFTCGLNKLVRVGDGDGDGGGSGDGGRVCCFELGGHCSGFSANKGMIISSIACKDGGEIKVIEGCKVVCEMKVSYNPTAVGISGDGRAAVIGSNDGKLHVHEIGDDFTFGEETILERHRGGITCIKYSPDSSMFATGDQNRESLVWDSKTKEVRMKNMLYHTATIKCIAWASDSSRVATGSVDSSINVYDIAKPSSARICIKAAHLGAVSGLAFITNSATLVSGGDDACLRVWHLDS